jgi:hypothetical protein
MIREEEACEAVTKWIFLSWMDLLTTDQATVVYPQHSLWAPKVRPFTQNSEPLRNEATEPKWLDEGTSMR